MGLRNQRLAGEIRDILAVCFQAETLNDPRLKDVTIIAVRLSPDLQLASVYFRTYIGIDESVEVKKGLEHAAGFLRRKLAVSLDIRRVPNLRFFYDESVERGARIEKLVESIKA